MEYDVVAGVLLRPPDYLTPEQKSKMEIFTCSYGGQYGGEAFINIDFIIDNLGPIIGPEHTDFLLNEKQKTLNKMFERLDEH